MKAAAFDYRCPADLAEAGRLLREQAGHAKLMGGGQSFGPMLNLRLTRPRMVVDVSRLSELAGVREDGDHVVIAAGVTHAEIEDGLHAPLRAHPMRQVAAGIAYRAVRNRGTLGGSLAHADPAADWIVSLTALGAQLSLRSPGGTRKIAMEDFMQAAYTTALADDEIIVSVRVPAGVGHWGYHKFCRKPGEFAEASAAVWWSAGSNAPRIVLGALDGAPKLLPALAQQLVCEQTLSRGTVEAAVREGLPEMDAVDRKLHAVCLSRALEQAGVAAAAPVLAGAST